MKADADEGPPSPSQLPVITNMTRFLPMRGAFQPPLVASDSGCLEATVRMIYCAAFDCNTNRLTCSLFKFLTEKTLFKKANFKPTKHSRLCKLQKYLFRLRSGPDKITALGYPGAKISLKEDDVSTLLPVAEATTLYWMNYFNYSKII